MRIITTFFLLMVTASCITGCGPKRPVLYPNDHLKQTGTEKANQDIDTCIQMAHDYKAGNDKLKTVATDTGKTAVVGAATGAVVGAFTGDVGVGAAIGAAGGATAALGTWLMRSDEPDPIFKQFVDKCLSEMGYQSLGWK